MLENTKILRKVFYLWQKGELMILITGSNGQLGTELRYLLDERGVDYVAVDVAEMDITNEDKVEAVLRRSSQHWSIIVLLIRQLMQQKTKEKP